MTRTTRLHAFCSGMLDTASRQKETRKVDDVIESGAYRHYMHRPGHWMAWSARLRDTRARSKRVREGRSRPDRDAQPSRICGRHGATIEPGIYVRPAKGVPKEFWNIGIRIETTRWSRQDLRVLTRGVPVDADDIERLWRLETGSWHGAGAQRRDSPPFRWSRTA